MKQYSSLKKYACIFKFIIIQNALNYMDIFFDYALFAGIIIFLAHGTALDAALLAVSYNFPKIIFSSYVGKVADSYNYRNLFLLGNLIILISTIGIFATYQSNLIFISIFFKSLGRTITGVGMPKLITLSIEDNDFQLINCLVNLISNAGKVVGPIFAGILLMSCSLQFIFTISVIIACLLITSVIPLFSNSTKPKNTFIKTIESIPKNPNLKDNVREVIQIIVRDNLLKTGLISYCLAMVAIFMSDDLLSVLFRELGGQVGQIGILIAVVGIGGVIGSQLLLYINNKSSILFLKLSLLFDAVCFILFGYLNIVHFILPGHICLLIIVAIMGVGTAFGDVGFKTVLYEKTDQQNIGLLSGVIQAFVSLATLLCPLIGGFIANKSNIFMPFRITGVLMAMLFAYTSFTLSIYEKTNIKEKRK